MKLSLCICTFNNHKTLNRCLKALGNQTEESSSFEVLVLDNTSENSIIKDSEYIDACKNLCDKNENYRYIYEKIDGEAAARNRCIDYAKGELIYFIDDDLILEKDSISNCIEKFQSTDNLGALGGKVIADFQGEVIPEWVGDLQLNMLSSVDFGEEDIILNQHKDPIWIVGANMCFLSSCFENGLRFDENLGRKGSSNILLSGVECKLIAAVQKSFKVMYTADCCGHHLIPKERLNQDWFIKRAAWQSISDVISRNNCMKEIEGLDSWIELNINILFEHSLDENTFTKKLNLIKALTFKFLS
jgi:glycosyltransferase involved in cell wall biosynthesis